MGWANSSIRHPNELPVISPGTKLNGVIREDPLEAALHPQHAAEFRRASGSAQQAAANNHATLDSSPGAQEDSVQATASTSDAQQEQQQAVDAVSSSANALRVLGKLQSLPWRRIDVSFQHSKLSFFAHNNIQVTRKWLNWEGAVVCQHLAQQFATMEKDKCIQNFIANTCHIKMRV